MDIKEALKHYHPMNEQEEVDLKLMTSFINAHDDYLERSNLYGHMTSSAFIVNKNMDKIVFGYHNIYQSWSWIGGHADGDYDLLQVAIKETHEETGLKRVYPFDESIFSIDVIYVANHIKHKKYIPDHLHLNISYLLIADEEELLYHNQEEHQGVAWFNIDDVLDIISENRMKSVYEKAIQKIKMLRNTTKF